MRTKVPLAQSTTWLLKFYFNPRKPSPRRSIFGVWELLLLRFCSRSTHFCPRKSIHTRRGKNSWRKISKSWPHNSACRDLWICWCRKEWRRRLEGCRRKCKAITNKYWMHYAHFFNPILKKGKILATIVAYLKVSGARFHTWWQKRWR